LPIVKIFSKFTLLLHTNRKFCKIHLLKFSSPPARMKETNFIKQNLEKWERLEKAIDNPREKADELSDLFVQITDDLSYSRTFYPNRSIRAYLNWLAQRLFFKIYRAKRLKKNSFFNFWTDELPQIMYESRREVLLAFSVFMLSMFVGAFSQHMDPNFANIILGDGYVNETIKNIESGDPLAIYKSSGPFGMSIGIVANNLWVSLLCFLLGVFASIGSIGMLVSNGVMVGVFQYFFYERGGGRVEEIFLLTFFSRFLIGE